MQRFMRERFEVVRVLNNSRGVFSFVGHDRWAGERELVVKCLSSGAYRDVPAFEERLARLRGMWHPLLGKIGSAGFTPRRDFFITRKYCSKTPGFDSVLPEGRLIGSLIYSCRLLHSMDLVHGRIKPSNLALGDEVVELLDGGLPPLREAFMDPQDLCYIAPEVLTGSPPSCQSDLYSLGAVLYHLYSRAVVFADSDVELLRQKCVHARPSPLSDVASVSNDLSEAVSGLLEKEPSNRLVSFERLLEMFPFDPIPAERTPLIGRDDTLEQVLQILSQPRDRLRLLPILGEVGVGKTRFLDEVAFRYGLRSGHFLTGRCFERENRRFEPLLQILKSRLKRHDRFLKIWADTTSAAFSRSLHSLLPDESAGAGIPEPETDAEIPRMEKLVADLTGVLISLAGAGGSLVLAIDDVQWADEGTLQVLQQLCIRSGETDACLILAARTPRIPGPVGVLMNPSENSEFGLSPVLLTPLSSSSSTEVAKRLARDAATVPWVVENGSGNPLFLEECARYGRNHAKNLPQRVRDVLAEQGSRLSRSDRYVAETLSLFHKPVSLDQIEPLLNGETDRPRESVRRLIDSGVLEQRADRVSFRHDGVRQTLYRHIAPRKRKKLHLRVTQRLLTAGGRNQSEIAHHAARAGSLRIAGTAYCDAALSHVEQGDYREAVRFFERARRICHGGQMVSDHELAYAECLVHTGKPLKARPILWDTLKRVPRDGELRASLYRALASCSRHSPRDYVRLSQAALRALPPASERRALFLLNIGQALAFSGRLSQARQVLNDVERISASLADQEESDSVAAVGVLLLSLCEHHRALAYLGRSGLRKAALSPMLLTNRAICLEHLGKLEEAIATQREAQELSRQQGMLFGELQSLANLGAFETKRGNLGRAAAYFTDAERFCRTMRIYRDGDRTNLPLLTADHAILLMERGEYAQAGSLMTSAVRQLKGDRTSQKALWVAVKQAELGGRIGDFRKARRAFERIDKSELFDSEFFKVERALASRWLARDSLADQSRSLKKALALTKRLGTLYQRCRVLIELGDLEILFGSNERASAYLAKAHALARQHGYSPLRPRVALCKGLATRDRARARYLSLAYALASKLCLPELTAEAAFRLAEHYFQSGQSTKAKEYCAKSLATIDGHSSGLTANGKRAYLDAGWRRDARSLSARIASSVQSESGRARSAPRNRKPSPSLFKTVYETTKALAAAKDVSEVVEVVGRGMMSGLGRGVIVFLSARGQSEFFEYKLTVDSSRTKRIKKLSRGAVGEPVFEDVSQKSTKDGKKLAVAWIPLAVRGRRFGGLYVEVGPKRLTESEVEFLTTLSIIAASHVAAAIWSEGKSVEPRPVPRYNGIVGVSPAIQAVCSQIEIASRSHATVLIEGESGTGKELVARAIHACSPRSKGPLVTVDCGAVPESLIESELFGSRRGSFTGATVDRVGLIEGAHRGTLFLDEISNTSPALQAKLLRVLQEKEVRRVGETSTRSVDVRLIAATNSNLESLVERGLFRQDLLFRLKVLHVRVPPLRERREDIPELAGSFLASLNERNKTKKRFHERALSRLGAGSYPGNVRELQNVVERAYYSTIDSNLIRDVGVTAAESPGAEDADVHGWYAALTKEGQDFWSVVHRRYKARDISREKVIALMDLGLRATRGSYKSVAALFNVEDKEYRRFMDFLRRNRCQPDFRPYRRLRE